MPKPKLKLQPSKPKAKPRTAKVKEADDIALEPVVQAFFDKLPASHQVKPSSMPLALGPEGVDSWLAGSPQKLKDACDAYFESVDMRNLAFQDNNPKAETKIPYTHQGLCLFLGLLDRSNLITLLKSDPHKPIMATAILRIEQDIVEGTLMGAFNPKMSSMYLTQCLAWLDGRGSKGGGPRSVEGSGVQINFVSVESPEDLKRLNEARKQPVLDVGQED